MKLGLGFKGNLELKKYGFNGKAQGFIELSVGDVLNLVLRDFSYDAWILHNVQHIVMSYPILYFLCVKGVPAMSMACLCRIQVIFGHHNFSHHWFSMGFRD